MLEHGFLARRCQAVSDELAVLKEVCVVTRNIDCDDNPLTWRLRR